MTASPIAFDLELADYTHRDHTAYSTEGIGFDAHKPTLRIVGNRGVQQGIITALDISSIFQKSENPNLCGDHRCIWGICILCTKLQGSANLCSRRFERWIRRCRRKPCSFIVIMIERGY